MALVVTSTALSLVLCEIGLRVLDRLHVFPRFFTVLNSPYTPFERKDGGGLYYSHPYTSYDVKPGYHLPDTGAVTINSLGFRGDEIQRTKRAGTYRIVALGGSTTYGVFLGDHETYPYYLGEELKRQFGRDKVEVINAGLVSATSAESLTRVLFRIVPLEPDMVVFYEGYNDLPPRMFNDFSDDYYSFRKHPQNRHPWLERSYLHRLLMSGLGSRLQYPNGTLLAYTWKFENLPSDDRQKISNFNGTSAAVYRRNVEHILAVAKSRGIEIVLATFPFNGDAPNWNEYMPDELWGRGIAENNEVIRNVAATQHLPLVAFHEYADSHKKIFLDSIHLTPSGNMELADVLAATIAPLVAQHTGVAGEQRAGR